MTRHGRAGAAAIAIAIVAVAFVPAGEALASAGSAIRQAGTISSTLLDSRRHLDADPGARKLFFVGQPASGAGMRVDAYDLDTLKPAGSVGIGQAASGSGGYLSAVDELRHRLFVLYPSSADGGAARGVLGAHGAGGAADTASKTLFGIAAVDTLSMRELGTATVALTAAFPQDVSSSNGIGVKAMTFHRDGNRDLLYLASEVPAGLGNFVASTHTVSIHEIDVDKLLDSSGDDVVDWSYPVPACATIMARESPGVLFASAQKPLLSLPCRQGGFQGVGDGEPVETPGVVQVRMAAGATGRDVSRFTSAFYPVSGNLQFGAAAVDPLAERLFLQFDGATTDAGIWVFDVPTATYIGLTDLPRLFAGGGTIAMTADPALARLYAISVTDPSTLRASVVEAATNADGADQGALDSFKPTGQPVKRRSVDDPIAHHLVVPTAAGAVVLADERPAAPGAPQARPDASTLDVAEGAGTGANFLGGTEAYGARIRWIGGTGGVQRNTGTYLNNPPSDLNPNTGGLTPPPPGAGTRDLNLARIDGATLTNGESSAAASGAERDVDNTDADAAGFLDYVHSWNGPDLSAERWPYPSVRCADFGNASDRREGSANGAQTTCRLASRNTSAVAVDESLSDGAVLRIGQARSRTVIARDPRRGIVSIAEAEALGVEIAGVAGIGRVFTHAETWASGRPRSSNGIGAGAQPFERDFDNVWVVQNGRRRVVCTTQCDPATVAAAINDALGARVRVDLPQPDAARAAGTPGGYEALVVRNPFERANEASVNLESDTRRVEVPAMVVTAFTDGRVPSRVVVSLAGVAAESHYGIYLVSQSQPFTPPHVRLPGNLVHVPLPGERRPAAASPGGVAGGIARELRRVLAGFSFAVSSPARAARTFGVLTLLAGPLVLLMRRRRFRGEP